MPRLQHAAAQLANGDTLFIGGDGAASGTSERFDVKLEKFILSGTLVGPRQAARRCAARRSGIHRPSAGPSCR
ncbi:MAG: hypothetical protein M3O80_07390 [Chloroflexota bacterium]|nr:hypothetical protein [Chloroflexota bacterium]